MKIVTVIPYYKCGVDLANFLYHSGNDPRKALLLWAEQLEREVKNLRKLVQLTEGKSFSITADNHFVGLEDLDDQTIHNIESIACVHVEEFTDANEEDEDIGGEA